MANNKKTKWEISPFGWNGISGVYCIYTLVDKKTELHYIGSSKNIGTRVSFENHPYKRLLREGYMVFIKFKECNNYVQLEKDLIFRLKPKMNKHGK